MDAPDLPELRSDVRHAAETYRYALSQYFAVHVERRAPIIIQAQAHLCRVHGAQLTAALNTLMTALLVVRDDVETAVELERLSQQRSLLADELALLAH